MTPADQRKVETYQCNGLALYTGLFTVMLV